MGWWLREVGSRPHGNLVLDNSPRKRFVAHKCVAVHQDVFRDEIEACGTGGVKLWFKPGQGHTDLLFEVTYPK